MIIFIQTFQLGRSVSVVIVALAWRPMLLLILLAACIMHWLVAHLLSWHKWWQIAILIASHGCQIVVVALSIVHVSKLWESDLIATVMILNFIKVILAPSDNIHSIILVSYTSITSCNANEVGWLIMLIIIIYITTSTWWHVIVRTRASWMVVAACLCWIVHITSSIMWVVLRLLTIDDGHSVDVVVGMLIVVLIPPHDQLLFCFL